MPSRAAAAIILAVGLGLAGCAGEEPSPAVQLDGSARYPDDQGIATSLTHERITLDGERTYAVSRSLIAFATGTATLEPMLTRQGQYVQIGLDGDVMVWMAGVAAVVDLPQGPRVFYTGRLKRVDDAGRLVFRDGTVWEVAEGLSQPEPGQHLQLEIDPARHRAVAVRGG